MKSYFFIGVVLLLQLSKINATIIDAIKTVQSINDNKDLPWKADTYGLTQITEEAIRVRLGTKLEASDLPETSVKELLKLAAAPATAPDSDRDRIGLPVNFTWADQKVTNCPIRHIRDQSNCGSCWAVSTVSALGDRFCIKTNGKDKEQLSENFVTACDSNNWGCFGGSMDRVNVFMTRVGTITGGDYESDVGCQMYTIMPCGFPLTHRMHCAHDTAFTPKCKWQSCNNDWYQHKEEPQSKVHKAKSWYMIRSNITHSREDRIREEIARNGPVTAGFLVPKDFYFYKKGVYVPTNNRIVGGHAVRVVGWGIENGIKYWHAANSWTSSWGDEGFFKILRGVNSLLFESTVSALEPKL